MQQGVYVFLLRLDKLTIENESADRAAAYTTVSIHGNRSLAPHSFYSPVAEVY